MPPKASSSMTRSASVSSLPNWQTRHHDDSKAVQGWRLKCKSGAEESSDTLYRTGLLIERNRHTTARYATADEVEYKCAAIGSSSRPGSSSRLSRPSSCAELPGAGVSKAGAVAHRRSSRSSREQQADHLSVLLAKRLQSIEVRQSGLDEAAFAQRLQAREIEEADSKLAAKLNSEKEDGSQRKHHSLVCEDEADAKLALKLQAEEEEQAKRRNTEHTQNVFEDDAALAALLQAQEQKGSPSAALQEEDADTALARLLQAEECQGDLRLFTSLQGNNNALLQSLSKVSELTVASPAARSASASQSGGRYMPQRPLSSSSPIKAAGASIGKLA